MQTYSQTFSTSQTFTLNVVGAYFILLQAANAVNIRFYKGGQRLALGEIRGVLPGIEGGPAGGFDQIQIDVTGPDTVTVGIGDGSFTYQRSQGDVAVTNVAGAFTNQNIAVTNASQQFAAANANRRYMLIQNKDASGNVYVAFDQAATVANGVKIPPGGSYDIEHFGCTSAINMIGDTANNPNVVMVTG